MVPLFRQNGGFANVESVFDYAANFSSFTMRTRRRFSAEFKAKVALEASQGPRDGRQAGGQADERPEALTAACISEIGLKLFNQCLSVGHSAINLLMPPLVQRCSQAIYEETPRFGF